MEGVAKNALYIVTDDGFAPLVELRSAALAHALRNAPRCTDAARAVYDSLLPESIYCRPDRP